MKLRRGYVLLAAVLGVATAVLPAIASSETSPTVEAHNTPGSGLYSEEHHSWVPREVSVAAGGVVTLRNPTTVNHGVEWISATKPTCTSGVPVGTTAADAGKEWSGTCTFSQPGTYTFYCTVHGPEMTGTVTVSAAGTTTLTTQTTGTTPTTTTPAKETSGSPLVRTPSLRSVQHGKSVHGSLEVSPAGAGDRLEVDVFATGASLAKAKHVKRVRVGRFVRGSVVAGRQSFTVALNAKARRALKRKHRLALTVKIALTPVYGEATTITRAVVVR